MPFPDLDPEFETFFEPTRIWLFGKHFKSLEYRRDSMGASSGHTNEFSEYKAPAAGRDLRMPPRRIERTLRRQSYENGEAIDRIFARIYSFSFEGHYYKLPRPLLFLVYGTGELIEPPPKMPKSGDKGSAGEYRRRPGAKAERHDAEGRVDFNTKFAGIEARDWHFSNDLRVWAVDKKDMAVCLDIEIANYQEILLNPMIASARGEWPRAESCHHVVSYLLAARWRRGSARVPSAEK